jgi:hypothetical protein
MKKRRLIKTGCRAFPGLRHAAGPSRAQRAALAPSGLSPTMKPARFLTSPTFSPQSLLSSMTRERRLATKPVEFCSTCTATSSAGWCSVL